MNRIPKVMSPYFTDSIEHPYFVLKVCFLLRLFVIVVFRATYLHVGLLTQH